MLLLFPRSAFPIFIAQVIENCLKYRKINYQMIGFIYLTVFC
jgi:hypothetical protein